MTDRALRYIPNSTQVMDVYFDKYMALLTGAEWKTLCYAIRRIFGFKRESDWISLDQFVNGIVKRDGTRLDNGTGMARGTVVKALDFLKKVHLLQTRGVLGSTPEYSLNLDPELIDHKTLNKRQAETVKGNHQKVAKARKHNPRVGVSVPQKIDTRSVQQDAPRSVQQDTQESVNQESADNSSELGVPNSTELAENASTHLSAAPVLNPAEREILRACNDGVVIAHYHNAEAANHLIELGMIERCQCGAKDVLCLKGKCPTHDKARPDDVKVDELQTALQQSFLPSDDTHFKDLDDLKPCSGNGWYDAGVRAGLAGLTADEVTAYFKSRGFEIDMSVHHQDDLIDGITYGAKNRKIPLPLVEPPAPPAPAALPEVPFKPGDFVWWVPAEVQRNLCGTQPRIAAVVLNLSAKRVHILSDRDNTSVKAENLRPREKPAEPCEWEMQALRTVWSDAKAAARAQQQGKAKAPREHDVLFKACATEIMGYAPENGMKYTKSQCQLINGVKGAIMRVMNLSKTPADYQRGADEIPKYKRTFKEKHPNLDYPTHASFESYFKAHWDANQPKPEPDTSCPECHGTHFKLIKDKFGVEVAHPCPTCQKEAAL